MEQIDNVPIALSKEDIAAFLMTLPRLQLDELPEGECCAVCLNTFSSILEEARSGTETAGVTKLQCGHAFCMQDISEWINTPKGTCPTCRNVFLVIPEPADDESSDGGEYIPGSDDVVDDMMDMDTWTDEEMWSDAEAFSMDEEGITESDSSWERSSQPGVDESMVEDVAPAVGQVLQASGFEDELGIGASSSSSTSDASCDQILAELSQWRTRIEPINVQDWVSKKDETRSLIHQGFLALTQIKPRVDALNPDTAARRSMTQSIMTTIQELHADMQAKLNMIHQVDQYLEADEH
ncbi:hypothetical protein M422DRAFT_22985 [Sphaerobolus stellatus SS14]|nr:hypothetical protein M422DRAFT_22985 [Sphaerobolus stellatus SS14]